MNNTNIEYNVGDLIARKKEKQGSVNVGYVSALKKGLHCDLVRITWFYTDGNSHSHDYEARTLKDWVEYELLRVRK